MEGCIRATEAVDSDIDYVDDSNVRLLRLDKYEPFIDSYEYYD